MRLQQHDYATRPALLRRAIDAQQGWIEEKLGVPVSETVIFETSLNLSQSVWRKFSAALRDIPELLARSEDLGLLSKQPRSLLDGHRC